MDFKFLVAKKLDGKLINFGVEDIYNILEVPPDKNLGDFAFPCFRLAKEFRKAPNIIAKELVSNLKIDDIVVKIEANGGYVNFYVDRIRYSQMVIKDVLSNGDNYGESLDGKGKTVVLDFSAPNIAKPFHIGHIRSTVIGNSLSRIYKSQGYDIFRINYLGDYGTQFGKLIVAFKKWGDKEKIELNPIKELLDIYVKFHKEAKEDSSLEDEAREWFTKLENGDEEAYSLWKWFREESLKEFNRVYELMGIEFDSYNGESFYSDKMGGIIDILNDKGLLSPSRGTNIVNLDDVNLPPALITKNDGSTLYLTRDLASAIYRKESYNFYKSIYVVASQQELHFKQLFSVLDKMGHKWNKDMIHVPFGMVSLESGKMSTRDGRVVFLEDVLRQAISKTKETIIQKGSFVEDLDEVSRQVGVGAVVFKELSTNRIKDYSFSLDKTLSFDGETGPYVQYTHARCCSVLRKVNGLIDSENVDYKVFCEDDSFEIISMIKTFNEVINTSLDKNEPHIIARYVLDLSKLFNKYYHDNKILVDDKYVKNSRLLLVYSVKTVIKKSLSLLGIEAPERM